MTDSQLKALVRKAYSEVAGPITYYDGMKRVIRYKARTAIARGSEAERKAYANQVAAEMMKRFPELPPPSKDTWYVRATRRPRKDDSYIAHVKGGGMGERYVCAYVAR